MAEGAGALLLEDWEQRRARAAPTIYAEVLGYGASNDAHHMAQPEPEATGVAAMMRAALDRAGVEPERVGYINAHGTSTPLGDAAETKAIKDVFGDHAYELAVSSTKSMMGHTFGAAGAIEAIMCVLALRDGMLPPTINYREPDPDCDLDYVPNEARAGHRSTSRSRTRWASAATTAACCSAARKEQLRLTLVRHATLLLETSLGRILVDPMLRGSGHDARRSRTRRTRCATRSSSCRCRPARSSRASTCASSRTCTATTSTTPRTSSCRATCRS